MPSDSRECSLGLGCGILEPFNKLSHLEQECIGDGMYKAIGSVSMIRGLPDLRGTFGSALATHGCDMFSQIN